MTSLSKSCLLGIDVGTSGVKVLLMDIDGHILAVSTERYEVLHERPLFAEQDPEVWWEKTCLAIRKVIEISGCSSDSIQGIGLTGQMHSLVVLDSDGKVIRPAILWSDQRTQPECDWMNEHIGSSHILRFTANPALPNFTATKLQWIRQHEPYHFKKIAKILLPKDYIRYCLTGEYASDVSDASGTLLFDVRNRHWSQEMCERLEIPMEWLPRVLESPELTGTVNPTAAAKTGLQIGTKVVAGAGDQASGAVGNGIVRSGVVSSTIGTSGVVFAFAKNIVQDEQGRLHSFCHAVPGAWHVMGVTQAAGGSLQWYAKQFAPLEQALAETLAEDVYNLLAKEAAQVAAGSEGLVYLPYLLGERTPHLDPYARAVFFGVTVRHKRAHFVRGIMEGVSFSLRDSLSLIEDLQLPIEEIRLSGGGAKSDLWCSIQTNIYGRSVHTVESDEGPAFGAAILAGVGTGCFVDVESACDLLIMRKHTYHPQLDEMNLYNRQYAVYKEIYELLKPLYRKFIS
ncbi:xylulokinase [Alicyclobacillus tolerans]|uniref:xylulokinase n=1 Tax=Alicyclobacillus tolerans TaxID=90970 RepID=UPI0009329B2D|nr:xylulokinase [Alicyclobacillus montanus]